MLQETLSQQELEIGYQEYLKRLNNVNPWQKLYHIRIGSQSLTYPEFVSYVKEYPDFYQEWCK